jgi:ribonuclease P protein component
MIPPKARQAGQDAEAAVPSAVVSRLDGDPELGATGKGLQVIRQRADFLRAARAARAPTPAFLLQARLRGEDEPASGLRVGFTCSRKVGNAVIRNRAKRRLRALSRLVFPDLGQNGWDYVLVGRPAATIGTDFAVMQADLRAALSRVHRPATRT